MSNEQLQQPVITTPPRPSLRDDAYNRIAAEALLPAVAAWLGDEYQESERDHTVAQLEKALKRSWTWDGFDLATDLKNQGWSCDIEMVEILDRASSHRNTAHKAATLKWVRDNDIKPALPVGAAVKVNGKYAVREHRKDEMVDGVIVSIDLNGAIYTVSCSALGHIPPGSNEMGTIGVCLPFEEIEKALLAVGNLP